MIFIFGSPRSGSTWLGKIFDSHPDLLYLHEPDIPDRGADLLPHWFEREPTLEQIENARLYLSRLTSARHPRTIGIRPFFRKNYRGLIAERARLALIFGTKISERAGLSNFMNRLDIPDIAKRGAPPQIVLKSVSALGRSQAFLSADRSIRPVLVIRHPCAFVSSMLRGKQVGGMGTSSGLGRLGQTRAAMRLEFEALDTADEVTALAWAWLLSNAEAYPAIEAAGGAILNYDELARDPARHAKDLFARLSLGWPDATATFLARSQQTQGDYYSVFRDSSKASERWRDELEPNAIEKIREIVGRDPLGAQFFS